MMQVSLHIKCAFYCQSISNTLENGVILRKRLVVKRQFPHCWWHSLVQTLPGSSVFPLVREIILELISFRASPHPFQGQIN